MDFNKDIESLISEIIHFETRWLRHYLAEVVDTGDTIGKGRVKVTIPELGFEDASVGVWCFPRQADSLSVPLKGSWVEVYFMSGDPNRAVYMPYASEITGNTPSQYNKVATTRVLFQSPKTGDFLKYDDTTKELEIKMKAGTTEYAPLVSKIKTVIDAMIDIFNNHVHAGVTAGGASTAMTATPMTKQPNASYASPAIKVS